MISVGVEARNSEAITWREREIEEEREIADSFSGTWERMAGTTGLEPAASAVTGQRSNQLNYVPTCQWKIRGLQDPAAENQLPVTESFPLNSQTS